MVGQHGRDGERLGFTGELVDGGGRWDDAGCDSGGGGYGDVQCEFTDDGADGEFECGPVAVGVDFWIWGGGEFAGWRDEPGVDAGVGRDR